METNVRDLKAHLSAYLRRAARGEEVLVTFRGKPLARLVPLSGDVAPKTSEEAAIASLRTLPWVTPGNGNKPLGSSNPVRIGPDEQSLADIVGELRG